MEPKRQVAGMLASYAAVVLLAGAVLDAAAVTSVGQLPGGIAAASEKTDNVPSTLR